MTHRKVSDVMTADVVTVTEDAPFKEVAEIIAEHGISAVPVLGAQGRVTGVVSEMDLLCKEEYQEDPGAKHAPRWGHRDARHRAAGVIARDVMTSPSVTIAPDAGIVAAARALGRHHVGRLVVITTDGWLAGIVTPSDLLKVYLRPDAEIREEILRKIIAGYLGCDPARAKVAVSEGVVTLAGYVEKKSMIRLAVGMSRAVDGVVDVIDHLGYTDDDTHATQAPEPLARWLSIDLEDRLGGGDRS
jgi:CBS domain-containing protein